MVMGEAEARVKLSKPLVKYCGRVVRSDVYRAPVKHGCYFGGVKCVHPEVEGFGACVGCSRFVR